MASGKNSGRRRFITREHTSDTSEADSLAARAPEEEREKKKPNAVVHLTGDAPSAFVRVKPSSKSESLDRSYSNSKNGLILSSSRRLPQSTLVPKNSEHNPQSTSKWNAPHLQPVTYPPMHASPGFIPDSLSLGFRPIRRDSLGSESSSLAGSTVDSELTISNAPQGRNRSPINFIKPPLHPATKDHTTDSTSRLRPWSYYDSGTLMPRSVLSSTGSASSYDNLDKPDPQLLAAGRESQTSNDLVPRSPAAGRRKCSERNPKCTPSPPGRSKTTKVQGSPFRSDEDRQGFGPKGQVHETVSGEDKNEIPHFLEGICRRRMAGGHVQVIPPHLVGVFDPSRCVPSSSHVPCEATGDKITGIPGLNEAERISTTGKSMPLNNTEIIEIKSGEIGPSSKLNFPYAAGHHKPVKLTSGKSEFHAQPLPSRGSGGMELSSSENETTYSFKNANAGKEQGDDVRSKVFDTKISQRVSNSTSEGDRNKASVHSSDLSSVNDLFHYTVAKSGAGPSIGRTEKQGKCDVQMPNAKTMAFRTPGHSSMPAQDNLKHASSLNSKNNPKWNSSGLSVSNHKFDPTRSPKGSPKWEPPKLSKEGSTQIPTSSPKSSPKLPKQKSSPGTNPKWQYSPLAKSGQTYEAASSPKSSPKYERTATAKSSPRTTRVQSAKTSVKYENTGSPKSSPKAERNSVPKHSLKLETSSSKVNVQAGSQLHSQNSSKWEPPKTAFVEPATSGTTSASKTNDLEPHEMKVDVDKAENNVSANRFSHLHSSSVSIQAIGGGTKLKGDKEKRKPITGISHLPSSLNAADSMFPARRKPLFQPSSKGTPPVDLAGEKAIEGAFKTTQKQGLTTNTSIDEDEKRQMRAIVCDETDGRIFSEAISDCPRKVADDVGFVDNSVSGMIIATNDENKSLEFQRDVTALGDVQNAKMTGHDSEEGKVLMGQTADAVTVNMEKNSKTEIESYISLDTEHGSINIQDKADANPIGSSITFNSRQSMMIGGEMNEKERIGSTTNPVDGTTGKLELDLQNAVESSANGIPGIKNQCPRTKLFTDISESIQVVTQPCGSRAGSVSCLSSLVDAPCMTPVDPVDVQMVRIAEQNVLGDRDAVTLQAPCGNSKLTAEYFNQSSEDDSFSQQKSLTSVVEVVATTAPSVDAVNNNLPEAEFGICSESKMNVSNDDGRLNSVGSSPLAEVFVNQEVVIGADKFDEQSEINAAIIVPDIEQFSPSPLEKAIFTIDKEITFISRLVESPENKCSLSTIRKAESELHKNSAPALKDSEKPMLYVPVSSLASPPTDVFVTLTVHPLDETPGAFQEPGVDNIQGNVTLCSNPLDFATENTCIIPTCEPMSPPANTIYDCKLVSSDSVQIPVLVGEKESFASHKRSSRGENKRGEMLNSKSNSESNGQAVTESRGSSASSEQIAQGEKNTSEINVVSRTSEMPVTLHSSSVSMLFGKTESKSNNTGNINVLHSNVTPTHELSTPRKCKLLTADQKSKLNDNKWPENIPGHPDIENAKSTSSQLPDVSPVMAALDDALAVLTSVVMDSKKSETARRIAAPVEKSKKKSAKQDVEKMVVGLHPDVKRGEKSQSTTKEVPSSHSKKKPGTLHKGRSSPMAGSHHSDPQDTTDIVRQEIQMVESRRHQLVKEDSFNRPDSPMFHETLPLPKDSIIKRNREKCCDSTSSSDNNGSPQTSPRLAPRSQRRCKRGHAANKSASLPAAEGSSYNAFSRSHCMSKTLSRHKSDIFLDTQSGRPSGQHFHKSRWHSSDTADAMQGTWPKTISASQGMDLAVTGTPVGDGKRRTERLPLRSDIQDLQQSLMLYNQQHGGRRGQSWMQMVDASVKGTVTGNVLLPGNKPS